MRALLCVWLVSVFALSGCRTSAPPAAPRDGATRPAATAAGFEAYSTAESRWVDPDAFLIADKARRPPNRWPDADRFPPYEETREHDELRLLTPDGPCEMYFFHTRWRRRADVRAWGAPLRTYQACGAVFSREIAFAP